MVRSERSVADYEEFFRQPRQTGGSHFASRQASSPSDPITIWARCLLGGLGRITSLKQEIEDWKELTLSTGLIKTRTHPSTEAARGGSNFAELSSTRHMRQIVIRLLELL